MSEFVTVIGAGLAGSEAAWQLAQRGVAVRLYEMRPHKRSPAHQTDWCAELVCSNSLRSDDHENNAVGVLHQEMREAGSLILEQADRHKVPAGGALAVDRDAFAQGVSEALAAHPNITLIHEELHQPPTEGEVIIATGPLTSEPLSQWLEGVVGPRLAFFDAIAPIVAYDSIDFSKAWKQSRYDKGDGDDYINCPMDKAQYDAFVQGLLDGEKVAFKEFERDTPYFDGCLPIEVMAERGPETLRHGPLKPVGLTNPHPGMSKSHAIVQLRQDNKQATLWNMVGFQTKLTWPEQKRIFAAIPGLEGAEFVRLGAIHRNTFLNAPAVLTPQLTLKEHSRLTFAGQITGVEGYVESAATGLLAGVFVFRRLRGQDSVTPPPVTAHGALLAHLTEQAESRGFQPMNVNFGLFPPLAEPTTKKLRKPAYAARALSEWRSWAAQALHKA
ncbi:methylenetetrahydrofolate--tRNA-(uracil(54)-C(5))-methyltransferase (FADH(2)-oxidizing) TrmFO [Magnetofaba australis]|nr:methylenetetrahydrofolate--tRNA-(uracil(54)-C(5))-methyltransferase (FADH(2)-oxidizing) TrmFO [Magnetofaba australis]